LQLTRLKNLMVNGQDGLSPESTISVVSTTHMPEHVLCRIESIAVLHLKITYVFNDDHNSNHMTHIMSLKCMGRTWVRDAASRDA
jgi:hypothetical protein